MARHLFSSRAAQGSWRWLDSCSSEAALPSTRRIVVVRHLFSSRAAKKGIWRLLHSCSTDAVPLIRRMIMARHLFSSRAASGIWRSRHSCSTEAARRLMTRVLVARHLFSTRAAQSSWRPPDSCSTVAARRLMRRVLMARRHFPCRTAVTMRHWSDSCSTMVALQSKSARQADSTLKTSRTFCLWSPQTDESRRVRAQPGQTHARPMLQERSITSCSYHAHARPKERTRTGTSPRPQGSEELRTRQLSKVDIIHEKHPPSRDVGYVQAGQNALFVCISRAHHKENAAADTYQHRSPPPPFHQLPSTPLMLHSLVARRGIAAASCPGSIPPTRAASAAPRQRHRHDR